MIKINLQEFIKQRYWFGWYYWNDCRQHRMYNSTCPKCKHTGEWNFKLHGVGPLLNKLYSLQVYKMPMNNVLWDPDLYHNND